MRISTFIAYTFVTYIVRTTPRIVECIEALLKTSRRMSQMSLSSSQGMGHNVQLCESLIALGLEVFSSSKPESNELTRHRG